MYNEGVRRHGGESISPCCGVNMYKCWSYDQLGASMRPCKKASWDRSSMLDWRKGDKLVRAEWSGGATGRYHHCVAWRLEGAGGESRLVTS